MGAVRSLLDRVGFCVLIGFATSSLAQEAASPADPGDRVSAREDAPEARADETEPPATLDELETRILAVLDETSTPAVGITLVSRDAVIWEAGFGLADVEAGVEATPDTLFRVGSISKMFVALSVMQLVEAGRLSLDEKVHDLVPEIEFENPWEGTDPVRLVHLLEHTTGFDDIHLVEFANNDPTPLTLKQGLDFHPDSRTSRWRPGTRFSYSNSGPAIAAFIVEKVTGQRFEDYVQEHIFDPLGMTTATYLLNDTVRDRGATLYVGGVRPTPYWHIIARPSGSINATAREMSAFVRMLLDRGELGGRRIVSEASLERMETPTTTLGAREGLQAGYGLADYTSVTNGFVFHGHNGGVTGGLADLGYLPEEGLGYAIMINSDNGAALQRLINLTRGFLTRGLEPPPLPEGRPVPEAIAAEFDGVYRAETSRPELTRFLSRLVNVLRLSVDGEHIALAPLLGGRRIQFVATTDRLARAADEPITSLALLHSENGRTRIQALGGTWVKVPAVPAWIEVALEIASAILMVSAVAFALVWGPRWVFGGLRKKPGIGLRAWPLLTVLLLVASGTFLARGAAGDALSNLGTPTVYSVGYAITSAAFVLAACWSIYVLWRGRTLVIHRGAYWHGAAVTAANAFVAGYLLYWGMIGVRLWAV